MEKKIVHCPEILFIGLRIRTSYRNELDPITSQIAKINAQFRRDDVDSRIPHRKYPGTLMVVYTNYASDEYDEYDYLIGEQVMTLESIPHDMVGLVIPENKYLRVTSDMGPIPEIIMNTWNEIWSMTLNNTLDAKRKYEVDFEIYDERSIEPTKTIFDVYLGIE